MQTQPYRNDGSKMDTGETPGGSRGIHGVISDHLARIREVNKSLLTVKTRLIGPSPSPVMNEANAKDPHEPSATTLHERLGSAISEAEDLAAQLVNIVG